MYIKCANVIASILWVNVIEPQPLPCGTTAIANGQGETPVDICMPASRVRSTQPVENKNHSVFSQLCFQHDVKLI